MTLSVQHFWFEPQLITKMQPLQNFRQLAESLRGVIVVASGEIERRRSDNRLLWERQPIRCKFVEQDDKTSDFWEISFPSNA